MFNTTAMQVIGDAGLTFDPRDTEDIVEDQTLLSTRRWGVLGRPRAGRWQNIPPERTACVWCAAAAGLQRLPR